MSPDPPRRASSTVWTIAVHEAPAIAVMAGAAFAGHAPLVRVVGTLLLAVVAICYAPLARTRTWARDRLVDVGAMATVMALPLLLAPAGTASAAGSAHHAVASWGPAGSLLPGAIVLAWLVVRVARLRRAGSRTPFSVVSGLVCAAGLLWMLSS